MSENLTGAGTKLPMFGREVEFFPLKDIEIQALENDERFRHISAAIQAAREAGCDAEEIGRATQGAVEACADYDFMGPWGQKQLRKPQFLAKVFRKAAKSAITQEEAIEIVVSDPVNRELLPYIAFGRLFGLKRPDANQAERSEFPKRAEATHPTQESQSIAS